MHPIIKEGTVFFYSDERGDLPEARSGQGYGLYLQDTRFLSRLEWELEGIPFLSLSAETGGAESVYRYTNKEVREDNHILLWRESLEVTRRRFIYDGTVYESFEISNLDQRPVQTHLRLTVDADFADMFVVRGFLHGKLGEKRKVEATPSGILFTYRGTDELIRGLEVKMDPAPSVSVEERILRVPVSLKAGEKKQIRIQWIPYEDGNRKTILDDAEAISRLQRSYREWMETCPEAVSDLPSWNELYKTSLLDYRMLMTDAGDGELPVAGVPWYAVPFGRDSLIAAWQALPVRPGLAKSVLRTMARFQGKKLDGWRDEEPGKIMHEIRYGELARTNQVPFTPYYGTIDATPLFLILIGEVYRWTGDLDFVREMADAAGQALDWIDRYGDPDNRGYVSYARRSQKGIDNQGWKDSGNSIVHQDGRLAEAPIALCEVQGYVYLARTIWAHLYALLGDHERSNRFLKQAEELKDRFRRDFWMSDEQFVALALDKDGQQVRTVTSNPGHCLMTGILDREEARMVARRLLSPDMFSGWGIRTMSSRATAYNPMSYHNGSVWPHDNSLILNGLKQLGFHAEAKQVMDGLLAAASRFPQHRLPELFCGYDRTGEAPVPYPVACSPQAWAAGTAFVMLSVMLGIEPDPEKRQISLSPLLPEGMNRLRVRRLCVGEGRLDLSLYKVDGIVHVAVEQNTTGWQIVLPPLSREKKS